jgi:hypothetical protein
MKKLLLLFVLLVLILACSKSSEPESVVENFLKALTTQKYDETAQYTEIQLFNTAEEKEYLDMYFPTMTYSKPKLVSKDDSKAVVSVELTAKDVDTIFQAFFAGVMQRMSTEPDFDIEAASEELDQQLKDAINAEDAPTKSMTVQLDLMLLDKDGKKQWTLINNDALQYGLYLQEPQEDLSEYEYSEEPEMTLVENKTVDAIFMGSDELSGLCSFTIGEELLHMYCAEDERLALEANYLNKKLSLSYDILGVAAMEAAGDSSMRLYVLSEFK